MKNKKIIHGSHISYNKGYHKISIRVWSMVDDGSAKEKHWTCRTEAIDIIVRMHTVRKVKPSRYSSYSFLTLALHGGEWYHALVAPYPPGTHWLGGWEGLRAGSGTEVRGKILCLCQGSIPHRPLCSQTLRWLSYPSYFMKIRNITRK
jgi:hypothetical protein